MKIFKGNNISTVYGNLIRSLKKQRIVGDTKELNNCCLVIRNPFSRYFRFPYRNISEDYANAEMKWYWSGSNSCKEIGAHAKMWLRLSDDGETNNSAYGYIIEKKYDYDQLQQIIELLKSDPLSRRAIINISDPCLNKIKTHDLQCTVALQFLIRDGGLQMTVYMRSNDVYFGLPYDYIYFVSLGKYVADKLGIKFTLYTHHATSMHMYLRNEDKFKFEAFPGVYVNIDEVIRQNYDKEYNI